MENEPIYYTARAGQVDGFAPIHPPGESRLITRLALLADSGLLGSPEQTKQLLADELRASIERGEVPEDWADLLPENQEDADEA